MKSKFNLAEWQKENGFTYDSAAKALGVDRATYARYLKMERESKELPLLVVLACKAVCIQGSGQKVPDE